MAETNDNPRRGFSTNDNYCDTASSVLTLLENASVERRNQISDKQAGRSHAVNNQNGAMDTPAPEDLFQKLEQMKYEVLGGK